ncbi:hypothetical protein V1523DRAFT_17288 [Lipomyces doorenjongii]
MTCCQEFPPECSVPSIDGPCPLGGFWFLLMRYLLLVSFVTYYKSFHWLQRLGRGCRNAHKNTLDPRRVLIVNILKYIVISPPASVTYSTTPTPDLETRDDSHTCSILQDTSTASTGCTAVGSTPFSGT